MNDYPKKRDDFLEKEGPSRCFLDAAPVMAGYVFPGFGFLWSAAMNLFVYAGSMQYMAVSLLTTDLSIIVVNAR